MDLPAEERHALKPSGRECAAPDCNNIIAATARVDAVYCSKACRERVRRANSRHENEVAALDTPLPQNVADNAEKTQQNQWSKTEGVLSRWEPTGDGKDVPDIPDFLRR